MYQQIPHDDPVMILGRTIRKHCTQLSQSMPRKVRQAVMIASVAVQPGAFKLQETQAFHSSIDLIRAWATDNVGDIYTAGGHWRADPFDCCVKVSRDHILALILGDNLVPYI